MRTVHVHVFHIENVVQCIQVIQPDDTVHVHVHVHVCHCQ